jgi:hypothetical protein
LAVIRVSYPAVLPAFVFALLGERSEFIFSLFSACPVAHFW